MARLLANDVRSIEDSFFNLLATAPGTKEEKQTFFLTRMKTFVPRSNYEVMWERLVEDRGPALAGEAVFDYVRYNAPGPLKQLLDLARAGEDVDLRSRELAMIGVLFFENGNLRRIGEHLVDYMDLHGWTWPIPLPPETAAEPGLTGYEYDVALSLAGEERPYVERVAEELRKMGIRVFYDEYEETRMWGKDLPAYLDEIFRLRARYCVMFLSKHYAEKAWPRYEGQAALARAIEGREEYILPARFDDTPFPGLPPTVKYLDVRHLNPAQLARRIARKLGMK